MKKEWWHDVDRDEIRTLVATATPASLVVIEAPDASGPAVAFELTDTALRALGYRTVLAKTVDAPIPTLHGCLTELYAHLSPTAVPARLGVGAQPFGDLLWRVGRALKDQCAADKLAVLLDLRDTDAASVASDLRALQQLAEAGCLIVSLTMTLSPKDRRIPASTLRLRRFRWDDVAACMDRAALPPAMQKAAQATLFAQSGEQDAALVYLHLRGLVA